MGSQFDREHQRHHVNVAATVVAPKRSVVARGTMLDLGVGGAAFELDTPLRMGETTEVHLVDAQPPVFLVGEVAWVAWGEASAVRVGVRFAGEDDGKISQLLDSLTSSTDDAAESDGAMVAAEAITSEPASTEDVCPTPIDDDLDASRPDESERAPGNTDDAISCTIRRCDVAEVGT